MINFWWVTRPKRKLTSVPTVLALFISETLNTVWAGQVDAHLNLEDALERAGLKRTRERRDQGGGGARTYKSWIESLGLIFDHQSSSTVQLTCAGEAIINGAAPVPILTNQVLKYQFPSSYSIRARVDVNRRFKIKPFVFLLRLLNDKRIGYLTEEEIAKIVITEAETQDSFEYIVNRILDFRVRGDQCLADNFEEVYVANGDEGPADPIRKLLDTANTFANWLDYTQLIARDRENGSRISILPEKQDEVIGLLRQEHPLIRRWDEHEIFQRKYGLDPLHQKDTRDLSQQQHQTLISLSEKSINAEFISYAALNPVVSITVDLIENIAQATGFKADVVEEVLLRKYPRGAIGSFLAGYFEMAFKGTEQARDFEIATANLFRDALKFQTQHVGNRSRSPDVLVKSETNKYIGIIDNKAYSNYSISNDHRNRMITNYIGGFENYCNSSYPLVYFMYIAGGFGGGFDQQVRSICDESGKAGSGIPITVLIKLIENNQAREYSHLELRNIFSKRRAITLSDL